MSTAAPLSGYLRSDTIVLPRREDLPDDNELLRDMVLELLNGKITDRQELAQMQHKLDQALRRLYGPRTERVNPDQPLLFEDASPETPTPATQDETSAEDETPAESSRSRRRKARPHGRRRLPENLPRRPLHHELTQAERVCSCGHMREDIGTEPPREQLDWKPASYFVWQHFVHKYLCPHCAKQAVAAAKTTEPTMATSAETTTTATSAETTTAAPAAASSAETTTAAPAAPEASATSDTALSMLPEAALAVASILASESSADVPGVLGPPIISAPMPAMPIEKGLPGPGLLAQVIVSKYTDHLPLYRQENITARQGVFLPRSTTCDWMAASAQLLQPLYDLMVARVLLSRWLHTDDTPVRNLGQQPDDQATARFWAYLGDRDHPYNVLDFTLTRKRDGPQQFLKDYRGYLHADAFSGYDALYLPAPHDGVASIHEVACNAHARRKFYEARNSDVLRAHEALAYYRQLYALERSATANGFDDAARLQMRQELSVPILTKFHAWLEERRQQVLPKSPMAEALGYALNQWPALCRYTEQGFLKIDNNLAEREMKRIATGRKNWLFVGSAAGGRTAAVLFSFTFTCQRLMLNPWLYLQDVLARLPTTPASGLVELLPDVWKAAHPDADMTAARGAKRAAPSEWDPAKLTGMED